MMFNLVKLSLRGEIIAHEDVSEDKHQRLRQLFKLKDNFSTQINGDKPARSEFSR